jgi:hypothetical protein
MKIVRKSTEAGDFIGVRLFIETPVTLHNKPQATQIVRGPYMRTDGDDDSSAVTFWALASDTRKLREMFYKAWKLLEEEGA